MRKSPNIFLNKTKSTDESNDGKIERNPDGSIIVRSAIPKKRQDLLKWNGWGYRDSKFVVVDGVPYFTGQRYPIGDMALPNFENWVREVLNIELSLYHRPQDKPSEEKLPPSRMTADVLKLVESLGVSYSLDGMDRLIRAHGHTLSEMFTLQHSIFNRIPDMVLWPNCHEDVLKIVGFANENDLVLIPFGGGTAVSGAVECPQNEPRPIISLDTSQMNRILWVDEENLVACCESGIVGQDLERELRKLGYTAGHEPDSFEFSTLGGWVATRASGMKKNIYGNIEDLLVHVKMVTPKGVLQKNCRVPRLSCGPDFDHLILGSEGSLGVITEVVFKIRPTPKCRKYGSVAFPNFESGVRAMREVARQRCQPSSIRLMDNEQFKFGHALKTKESYFGLVLDGIKKFYITKIKGFDLDTMCVMTLLFEGEKKDIEAQEKKIYEISGRCGGVPAGEKNGERGYMLTFVIAYIRDLGLEYKVVSESFETSVPWNRTVSLCANVKHRVAEECRSRNIKHYLMSCRVTQTYDAGCVIYFYFGFNYSDIDHPVKVYEEIEERARDEIISSGGSISHHHGVGKLRKKWYSNTVSEVGVALYKAAKSELDPNNIFATDNMIQQSKL